MQSAWAGYLNHTQMLCSKQINTFRFREIDLSAVIRRCLCCCLRAQVLAQQLEAPVADVSQGDGHVYSYCSCSYACARLLLLLLLRLLPSYYCNFFFEEAFQPQGASQWPIPHGILCVPKHEAKGAVAVRLGRVMSGGLYGIEV